MPIPVFTSEVPGNAVRRVMQIRIPIALDDEEPRCPYCGQTDPEPETHISSGRCATTPYEDDGLPLNVERLARALHAGGYVARKGDRTGWSFENCENGETHRRDARGIIAEYARLAADAAE